jgi:hypothetical protein
MLNTRRDIGGRGPQTTLMRLRGTPSPIQCCSRSRDRLVSWFWLTPLRVWLCCVWVAGSE